MIIYREESIHDFEPWGCAIDTYKRLDKEGKLDELEGILEDLYPDGMSETYLNDLLWFEEPIFNWLGIEGGDNDD